MSNTPLPNPSELKPSDLEAHMRLDDDGNPWNPLEPDQPTAWELDLRASFDRLTALMKRNPIASAAIAMGTGYLLGRVLAARAS